MKTFAVFMMVGIALITLVANLGEGDRVFALLRYVPGRDITAHFVLFALLGFSVVSWLSDPARRAARWSRVGLTALLALVVTVEEFGQALIPARAFSLLDLSASLSGILAGSLASYSLRGRTSARDAT